MRQAPVLSPGARREVLAKAKAARAAKHAARQASKLRRDFPPEDVATWEDLARAKGLRLPPWGEPCTVSAMRTWLHRVGLSQGAYETHQGKLADFIAKNALLENHRG